MSKVDEFTRRAASLHKDALARREKIYGMKPWYCQVNLIENGARVAFIGTNPGGGQREQQVDRESGGVEAPYDENRQYNAWLDDEHLRGSLGKNRTKLQCRVKEAFRILFGERGESVLRRAACFNVVPLRSCDVSKLSGETWTAGSAWCLDVIKHVSPEVIVCLGNGSRSAWSLLANRHIEIGVDDSERRKVYNNFYIKRAHITSGCLKGSLVIGLPHLSRVSNMRCLRRAARRLGVCSLPST